ncbi:MAG: SDR family oxidoreductase [Acidimicrobiaceae bacterium]|nr:SDR family oxidoreductase [Acidimicrobiaceae bacterium]
MGEVDGKRIVVTGASRGLGRAFAIALAGEGARLVVNGTNAALVESLLSEIRDAGGTASAVVGSVADDGIGARLVSACVEEFGGVDVVINNAGTVRDRTLLKMTPEEFDEVIAVNLRGVWSVSRHAASAMQGSGGLLLQVVSASAFTGSVGQTNYSASKAGVLGMMYAWDLELRRYGIRVNALWPVAQTDMSQVVIDNAVARASASDQPVPTPKELGFGSPAEVASVVVYLCSDRASEIRSQLVTFNGSKLALWSHPRETWIRRQPSWTIDELDAALKDAAEAVYRIEM